LALAAEFGPVPESTRYSPTAVSLQSHDAPDWFLDSKFGIFIHWGPYSIPAFAPHKRSIADVTAGTERDGFANTPYAAWYQNTMQFEGGATAKYHAETFGPDYPYERFGEAFNASL
jgi:alpha-L-fucosidase